VLLLGYQFFSYVTTLKLRENERFINPFFLVRGRKMAKRKASPKKPTAPESVSKSNGGDKGSTPVNMYDTLKGLYDYVEQANERRGEYRELAESNDVDGLISCLIDDMSAGTWNQRSQKAHLDVISGLHPEKQPGAIIQSGNQIITSRFAKYEEPFHKGFREDLPELVKTSPDHVVSAILGNKKYVPIGKIKSAANEYSDLANPHLEIRDRTQNLGHYGSTEVPLSKRQAAEAIIASEFREEFKPEFKNNDEEFEVFMRVSKILGTEYHHYTDVTKKMNDELVANVKGNGRYLEKVTVGGAKTIEGFYIADFKEELGVN